ncbi:MAG: hypothetical protein GY871_04620 [Actinomycetales bacterium]|nr:hypothetical protein [Actinomycetales bacterium]
MSGEELAVRRAKLQLLQLVENVMWARWRWSTKSIAKRLGLSHRAFIELMLRGEPELWRVASWLHDNGIDAAQMFHFAARKAPNPSAAQAAERNRR